jgi:hypothetical protein
MNDTAKHNLATAGLGALAAAMVGVPIWLATRKPSGGGAGTFPGGGTGGTAPGGTAPSGAQVTLAAVSLSVGG